MYLYGVDRINCTFSFTFTFSFTTKNYSHCFRTVLSPPHPQPPQFTVSGRDVSTNVSLRPDFTVVGSAPKTKKITFLCEELNDIRVYFDKAK
jgi:hypothetical protein